MKKERFYSFLFLLLSFLYSAQNVLVGTGFNASWPPACNNVTPGTYFSAGAGTSYTSGTLTANGTGDQFWRLGIDWSGSVYQVNNGSSTDAAVVPNTTYTANLVCTSTGALKYNVANTAYKYVFKTKNAGVTPSGDWVFFEVQGAVQSVSSVTASPSSVPVNMPVIVTATTSGSVNTGQAVYLRYTTNAWSTSTVVQMTGSGTSYAATIPGQVASTAVQYYVFTSGTANVASNGSNADFYTINLNNNSGSNYSYTVSTTTANVWVTSTGGTGSAGAGYTTLSAAFAAINAGTHTGVINVSILANTTEPADPVDLLRSNTPSNYTSITIRPSGNRTITGSGTTTNTSVIDLLGADNVTIDGDDPSTSGLQNLTITQPTSTNRIKACIKIASNSTSGADGANNITIKNCIITGSRDSSTATQINYGIVMTDGATLSTGSYSSLNTVIENNNITRCWNAIYANGASATYPNTGLQILRNTIGSSTAANGVANNAIYLSFTSTGTGSAIINGNDIRTGFTAGTASMSAIELASTNANVLITKNNIHDCINTTSSIWGMFGVGINSATNNTGVTIVNNFFRDISGYATSSLGSIYGGVGVFVNAAVSGLKINNNTFYQNISTAIGGAINFSNTTATSSQVLNNIFVNNVNSSAAYNIYTSATGNISGATVDNNNYYVTGSGVVGYYNAATRTTFSAWQTATSKDANSFNVNPSFVSTTDLHLNTTGNGFFESGGASVATTSVSDDFDGQTRPGPSGSVNGGATAPDIGADEFDGVPLGLDAGITAINTSAITCPGSAVASVTLKNYGNNTLTSVTINWTVNGVAQTPINWTGSLVKNATTSVNLGVYTYNASTVYTIVATTASPNGGVDGNTSNDSNTSSSFRTGLSGTYTIGVGKDFTTLTAAVAAANTNGVCGPVLFSLTDATYSTSETFPITINSLTGASATNTLTIKPATGVSPTITGSSAVAIIKLNGADYVTIDGSNTVGGTTKNLTISNTNTGTSSSVVWIATASASNGATYNTIKNTIVSGNSRTTTAAGIGSSSTTGIATASETDNAYNTIQNCTITGAFIGIGNYGNATSLDTGWTITGNTVGSASNARAHYYGIDLYNAKDFTITNNTVSGIFANNANSSSVAAIEAYGTVSNGVISGNVISDVSNNDNTVGYAGVGIYLGSTSATSNVSVYNNFIYDVRGLGFNGYFAAIGIWAGSGGGYNIYNNSVSINSSGQTATAAASTALLVSAAVTNTNVRNNIFYNYAATGNRYSVYSSAANTAYTDINYNDYYSVDAIGYLGGLQTTLANWQSATGKDANSMNVVPPFISASNLHITAGCTSLESGGTPIAIVTTDIDGATRSSTTPDIGADEFTGSVPPKISSVINGENCGAGTVLLTANSTDPGVTGYNWYTTPTGGTAVNGATPTSSNWTTPSLSSTTNYYVAAYNGSCESDYRFLVNATIKPTPTDISAITETQKSSIAITSACDVDYVELKATGGLVTDSNQYAFGTQSSQNNTTGSTAYPAPYTVYYGGQRMQILILASELTSAGFVAGSNINNIQFPVVSLGSNWGSTVTSCNNFQVSIGATSLTTLTTFQTGLTQVVAPANFTPTVGYANTHSFSTPFVWNGTSNIIVETTFSNNITGVTANTVTQYNSPTSYQSTIVYRADGVTASAAASATTISYSYNARPDFKLNGFTNTQKVTWSPITGLYTDTALTTPYNGTDYLTTVYAAPGTATAYTAKASIGTCEKTKVSSSIVRSRNEYVGVGADWNTASNWFPNVVPDANKCANIPASKTVVINNDALAKTVTIASTGKLTINANKSLTVTDGINITNNVDNNNLVMESDASLLQINNVANTGKIFAKRDVKMRKMDYTFWSTPVTGQALRNTSSSTGGTNPALYDMGGFSEGTPNNRIYRYNEPNDLFVATTDANFVPGQAYAIRGKEGYYSGTDPLILTSDNTLKFIGVPNNGNGITASIQKSKNTGTGGSVEHGYNMIGNPYPSNLDFISFYNFDQGGGVYNRSHIYGKAWFWTNTSPVLNQSGSNYTGSNYAVLSLAGSVAATGVDSGATTGSPLPTQYIKMGQGFIVQMKGTAPTGTTPNTATLKFDNSMRSNAAGVFYNNNKAENQKDRYWLKLVSPDNISNMILLAHLAETTNNYDADYDADLLTVGDDSFYSKLNTQKLQIQSRSAFTDGDIIPLGVKYAMNGSYKIMLSDKEGVFSSGQKIYLHDKLSNTYTDLTQENYNFQASKGLDETRFEIVYKKNDVLGTGSLSKSEFVVYKDGSDYVIRSSKSLGKVEMYDTSGKLIKHFETKSLTEKISMNGLVEGVYILKVENSGELKTQKIIK